MKYSQLSRLIRYLADRSITPQHELIERMLVDLGKHGTIECTLHEVGKWMELNGLCADYHEILDMQEGKRNG